MNAFLIDPFTCTIKEVDYSGSYKHIYQLIDCECFDVVRINDKGDGIFVDDEGLLHDKPQAYFICAPYPNPLAGKGLVLGTDGEGESISPKITIEELEQRVFWLQDQRMFKLREGAVN